MVKREYIVHFETCKSCTDNIGEARPWSNRHSSDLGLYTMSWIFFFISLNKRNLALFLLYFVPYRWSHHWLGMRLSHMNIQASQDWPRSLVTIAHLHRTLPDIYYLWPSARSFKKGALGTVDRGFGYANRFDCLTIYLWILIELYLQSLRKFLILWCKSYGYLSRWAKKWSNLS